MPDRVLVQKCYESDYDPNTETCSSVWWDYETEPSMLPALTVAEAQGIAAAIALLWAVAWCYKQIGKQIDKS